MILVTVGNATQGFPRLLCAIDKLAGEGFFGCDPVLMQTGNTSGITIVHCEHQAFFSMDEFLMLVQQARLVIAHAGAGTLFNVIQAGKIPIVMPRRKVYREHVDDHQIELVQALALEHRVIPALEADDLPSAVAQARQCSVRHDASISGTMQRLIGGAIEDLVRHR